MASSVRRNVRPSGSGEYLPHAGSCREHGVEGARHQRCSIAFMTSAGLFDLTGKVALVPGASSGLGARFAQVLAANGAAVALVARRVDRIAALEEKITAAGGRAVAIAVDVLDR